MYTVLNTSSLRELGYVARHGPKLYSHTFSDYFTYVYDESHSYRVMYLNNAIIAILLLLNTRARLLAGSSKDPCTKRTTVEVVEHRASQTQTHPTPMIICLSQCLLTADYHRHVKCRAGTISTSVSTPNRCHVTSPPLSAAAPVSADHPKLAAGRNTRLSGEPTPTRVSGGRPDHPKSAPRHE